MRLFYRDLYVCRIYPFLPKAVFLNGISRDTRILRLNRYIMSPIFCKRFSNTMEQYITFFGNHPMLSAVWLALVVMIVFITIKMKMSPIKLISPQELTFLVNREQGVVVDIRDDKAFKAGHIIDAKQLKKDKISKNDFSMLESVKDRPIIVVCNAGISAQGVATQLFKAGFNKVSVLKGGISAWLSAGLPVVKK